MLLYNKVSLFLQKDLCRLLAVCSLVQYCTLYCIYSAWGSVAVDGSQSTATARCVCALLLFIFKFLKLTSFHSHKIDPE